MVTVYSIRWNFPSLPAGEAHQLGHTTANTNNDPAACHFIRSPTGTSHLHGRWEGAGHNSATDNAGSVDTAEQPGNGLRECADELAVEPVRGHWSG